jgi:hypothetical protein
MDDPLTQAKRFVADGEAFADNFRWEEAAVSFRQAARCFHKLGDHEAEGFALRRAAQAYEALQPWRHAGQAWLGAAEAFSGHPHEAKQLPRKSEAGEAYLWAGYTFWWAEQHYDSFRAHFLAGDAFSAVDDLARAERAYKFAAISKAQAFATTSQINREVHPFFQEFAERDPVDDLERIAARRQQAADREQREFAARTHIDSLFAIRRSLEEMGNHEEASKAYRLEMSARRRYAREYKRWSRWLWLAVFGTIVDYGESFLRLGMWSFLTLLVIFPVAYAWAPGGRLHGARHFGDDVYFSLVTATTLGYGDMQPEGLVKAIANVESLVGLVAFGLLVSLIVRRVARSG